MISRVITLLLLAIALGRPLCAQQTNCEEDENYSISNFALNGVQSKRTANTRGSAQINFGSSFSGVTNQTDLNMSAVGGFFGYYQLEPQAPIVAASQGEYLDRIEVEWEVIDDRLGPMVTGTETQIWRNGRLMTSVPVKQTSFVDYNVFPGEFYSYEIVTNNLNGDSRTLPVVGFLNPNGRITGTVETRLGSPVVDAKVTLDPDLGRCLDFDGVDDYAYFTDEIITLNDYYTIEAWWRNVDVKNQTILTLLDSGTTTPVVKITLTEDGTVKWYHDGNADGTGTTLESRLAYNLTAFDRKWHHVAAVNDTTKMYLYVDGKRVAEADFAEGTTERTTIELGKDGKDVFSGYYAGQLDDLRLWDYGRSRADIRKYKDITLTGEEYLLNSYWKFDEQYGDKIYDYAEKPVSERHHGFICDILRSDLSSPAVLGAYTDEGGDYIIKGVYYGNGQTFAVNVAKETPIGFSLKMDGVDDYISYHFDRFEYSDAFTLEGWFKSAVSDDMTIYQVTNPETDDELFSVGLNTSGNFVVSSAFDGNATSITSSAAYNDEFWYHYAVTYDGASMKLYINSQEVGSTGVGAFDPILTRYVIGRSGTKDSDAGANYFNGWVDEMRLWNYARTATQVSATQNQVIPGDEQGIVDPEGDLGVSAYWNLGEGQGIIITDATPNNHSGEFKNAQVVDVDGEEIVTNWEGDDIPLQIEFFNHAFEPNSRNVSLDPSVTAVDRVDFTDISLLTVSGFVRFEGTNCFTEGVEVFVNGASSVPPVKSDESGKWFVEFEPGTQGQVLTFEKEDHEFVPAFIELPLMVRPIAGMSVSNTTKRKLKGIVAGGECHLPIGAAGDIQVIVSTQPYCYSDTVVVDEFGNFEFPSLPPQDYIVFVEHSDPGIQTYFDQRGALEVSLLTEDDSIGFIYRAPLEVAITGLEVAAGCDKIVLEQYTKPTLGVKVFENYFGGQCNKVNGQLTINDDISDLNQQTIDFSNGHGSYKLAVGVPNILSGGAKPYQKRIQVVAKDQFNRQGDAIEWVYVTGDKPRNVDFATTTPEIPYMILRSPPGDQSMTYLEEGQTFSNSMQLALASDIENNVYGELSLGGKVVTDAGSPVFTTQLEVETQKTTTGSLTFGSSLTSSSEVQQEITTTQAISTVPGFGDVYVGGAMNLLYGITDKLTFDGCEVVLSEDITFFPDGFHTTFIYSEDFIIGTVIPELESIGDTDGAEMWKQIIIMNSLLKKAAKFEENISFDGGAELSRSMTESITSSMTYETSVFIEPSIGDEFGFEVNGNGFSAGRNTKMRIQMGQSSNSTLNKTRTIGYKFADDDFGDNFTVNIKSDPVYGTPVFDMVSGASSCPYEGKVIDYAKGLNDLALDPIIQDLGKDILFARASDLIGNVGIGAVLDVVDGIDDILDGIGIESGLGDVISE
ncbi:MAG: LamG domain-containing protein, partial [Cyclobacteriaceae bacterium]